MTLDEIVKRPIGGLAAGCPALGTFRVTFQ